jgi:hypothetical protein
VLYHQFEETASSFKIMKRNISSNVLPSEYIMESVDNKGRVVELKFYKNNSTEFRRICYLSPWIKFEYPDSTTIVEYNFGGKGEKEDGLECEMPCKIVYYLSPDKHVILKSEQDYHIDTVQWIKEGWTIDSINKAVQRIKEEVKTCPFVGGYMYSLSKLNGLFPISEDFSVSNIYFSEIEKSEIEKALGRK